MSPCWDGGRYLAVWTCCCAAFRDVMTRERAVACTVTVLEPPLRVAFDYSSPQTYWHMCRNGENGRRDARQWEFSIYARLTRQGASPCSTMRYWVSCERCRGSRMCGRFAQHRTHSADMPLGRQTEQSNGIAEPPTLQLQALSASRQPRSHVETLAK